MNDEKSGNSQVTTDIRVEYIEDSVDNITQHHLEEVAENCGLGGMFISTDLPIPKGKIVTLNFIINNAAKKSSSIETRAIARWTQSTIRPHGMGVKFVEVMNMRKFDFVEWLKRLAG